MMKYTNITTMALAGYLLAGCGGGSGSSVASSGGGNGNNAVNLVMIDEMTTVPVVNGMSTKGTLYMHNYSDKVANNLRFSLGNQTTKSMVKSFLSRVGFSLNSAMENKDGFVLTNPERCLSIPAGGSCAINFTTPTLGVGGQGNSLVELDYNLGGTSNSAVQVVNYQYRDISSLSGVNFGSSLTVSSSQTSVRHVVGYLFGSGSVGTRYSNVSLNSTSAAVNVSNGFIDGQEVVAGQIIPVEFVVNPQNNATATINITPAWGGAFKSVNSAKRALSTRSLHSGNTEGSGAPLNLSVTTYQTAHILFGDASIMTAPTPTNSAQTINVTNNGNLALPAGMTATVSESALIITNGCSGIALAANACTIQLATNSYTPGSAILTFHDAAGNVLGTQNIYWLNNLPVPVVYAMASPESVSIGKDVTQAESAITFTVNNIGKAPLNNVTYTPVNSGVSTWSQDGTTCSSVLAPDASCAITGHFTTTADGTGTLYYRISGSFDAKSYSFISRTVGYTITSIPSLSITPSANVKLSIIADGESQVRQAFTVTNNGNDPALFSNIELFNESNTNIKPMLTESGTCTDNIELEETDSCTVIVSYGPESNTLTVSESGISTLNIAFHGGTPDTSYTAQQGMTYNVLANDSYAIVSSPISSLTGNGTESSPFAGTASMDPMTISFTYTNSSSSLVMQTFNVNTNNLPFGMTVKAESTTCATGANTSSIPVNGTCNLVLSLNRSTLASSPYGGSSILNFNTPTASWITQMGQYTQTGGMVYVTYLQPSVTFSLSNNNGKFESTTLSIVASNESVVSGLNVKVGRVDYWPVTVSSPSSNCVIANDSSVSCNLRGTNIGSVAYIMPTTLADNESMSIALLFSLDANQYASLNPSYTFINYVNSTAPTLSIIAGNGTSGTSTQGLATSTALGNPSGIVSDSLGNMYYSDVSSYRVLKVTTSGDLSFFAGNGESTGIVNTTIAATGSPINPGALATDSANNVYIYDTYARLVYKVTQAGVISLFAGSGSSDTTATPGPATSSSIGGAILPNAMVVDSTNNLYLANSANVLKITPDGTLSIFAGSGCSSSQPVAGSATSSPLCPVLVAADGAGNVYAISSTFNSISSVVKISSSGTLSIIAGNGTSSTPVAGSATATGLGNYQWFGLVSDSTGNIYFSPNYTVANSYVYKVNFAGNLSIYAGNGALPNGSNLPVDGTDALSTPVWGPLGADPSGNIYVAYAAFIAQSQIVNEILKLIPSN